MKGDSLLQAALNGDREHPAAPCTPEELAAEARAFVASGIAPRCVRAMVEPLDPDPHEAVAHAETIERALAEGGVRLEQVHHGDGIASWAVNRRAAVRGHGIRTGLEDTPVLPDGRTASGNGELVSAAASLLAHAK